MRKFTCLAFALALAFALFACGKRDTPAAVTDPTEIETKTEAIEAPTVIEETSAEDATSTDETTALPGEVSTTVAAQKPGSIAEIVAYYNTAANKVKTDKPGYSFTEQTKINSFNGGSEWLMEQISKLISSETPQAETVAKGAEHKNFAVPGKDWASMLNASAVESASCTEKGDLYEIRINLKREVQNDLPKNVEDHQHGRVFKVYNHGMVYGPMANYEYLGKIEKFAPTYTGSYLICAVDKTTGNMKSAEYYLTFEAAVEGKGLSLITVRGNPSISVTGKYVF